MALLFSLLLTVAHAGGWSQACAKFFSLDSWIMEDPYQFEGAPDDWLERQIAQLEIKVLWNKAKHDDRTRLNILYRERDNRRAFRELMTKNQ